MKTRLEVDRDKHLVSKFENFNLYLFDKIFRSQLWPWTSSWTGDDSGSLLF